MQDAEQLQHPQAANARSGLRSPHLLADCASRSMAVANASEFLSVLLLRRDGSIPTADVVGLACRGFQNGVHV